MGELYDDPGMIISNPFMRAKKEQEKKERREELQELFNANMKHYTTSPESEGAPPPSELIKRLTELETEVEYWKNKKSSIESTIVEVTQIQKLRKRPFDKFIERYIVFRPDGEIENVLFNTIFCWYAATEPYFLSMTGSHVAVLWRIFRDINYTQRNSRTLYIGIAWNPKTGHELLSAMNQAIELIKKKKQKKSPPQLPVFLRSDIPTFNKVGTPTDPPSHTSPLTIQLPRQS